MSAATGPVADQIPPHRACRVLRRGVLHENDAAQAVALGATAVLIGRPQVHALAVAGALGVAHMLRLLGDELEIAMVLCGCASLAEASTALFAQAPFNDMRR